MSLPGREAHLASIIDDAAPDDALAYTARVLRGEADDFRRPRARSVLTLLLRPPPGFERSTGERRCRALPGFLGRDR